MLRTFEQSDPHITMDGLQFLTVKSAALGMRADITLFVPQQAHLHKNLPIVILLHGVYGSHWAWALKGGVHVTATHLMNLGAIAPMILAMPSDGLWGDGSGYVKHTVQDVERWIVEEVPTAVCQATSACTSQSPLFISGLSMGGWGALHLGAKYRSRFSGISAHSSVTDRSQYKGMIIESDAGWSQAPADRNLLTAILLAGSSVPPLRFDCGTDDFLIEHNRRLHQQLVAAAVPHLYEELPGAHDWDYWSHNVERSLRFFSEIASR